MSVFARWWCCEGSPGAAQRGSDPPKCAPVASPWDGVGNVGMFFVGNSGWVLAMGRPGRWWGHDACGAEGKGWMWWEKIKFLGWWWEKNKK